MTIMKPPCCDNPNFETKVGVSMRNLSGIASGNASVSLESGAEIKFAGVIGIMTNATETIVFFCVGNNSGSGENDQKWVAGSAPVNTAPTTIGLVSGADFGTTLLMVGGSGQNINNFDISGNTMAYNFVNPAALPGIAVQFAIGDI